MHIFSYLILVLGMIPPFLLIPTYGYTIDSIALYNLESEAYTVYTKQVTLFCMLDQLAQLHDPKQEVNKICSQKYVL